ncbi:hypothetical protein N9Y81_00585 [Akkermansiaceae bacterium]|nr:hypothetical protein [Akkermansiaceae bacterium]
MNFFLHFTSFFGDLFVDAFFGLRDWLKINDFSGARRRKRYLDEAPVSFANDGVPVVLDSTDDTILLFDENGFTLRNRTTKKFVVISQKDLRRFARRGMKGLLRPSIQLPHS